MAEKDSDDSANPYLLPRPQFEMADGGEYYIETHDKNYIDHVLLRCVEFTPKKLFIEIDRPMDNLINVIFDMTFAEFKRASRLVRIIRRLRCAR